jgi:hypothetical protein
MSLIQSFVMDPSVVKCYKRSQEPGARRQKTEKKKIHLDLLPDRDMVSG